MRVILYSTLCHMHSSDMLLPNSGAEFGHTVLLHYKSFVAIFELIMVLVPVNQIHVFLSLVNITWFSVSDGCDSFLLVLYL